MPRTLSYKVILEPSKDGGYSVYVPSLPGCVSEGDSYQEALENIREAIRGWLEVAQDSGDDIPTSDVLTEAVEVSI
jgi:predicted RNase H-like HicB family nuclease